MATAKQIFDEINNTINPDGTGKRPTMGWIAGTFKKTFDFDRMERTLRTRADDLDEDKLKDLQNTLKLRDIAIKNGLMVKSKTPTGVKYNVTPAGNRFVQELSHKMSEWESINDLTNKQLKKVMFSEKGHADQEWYDSLPKDQQKLIDLYTNFTVKELHFLIGLYNSKQGKNEYIKRVETLEDTDFESYSTLREAGFINSKNQLNGSLVTEFFKMLKNSDYEHLRSFNRSISSFKDHIAAMRGLKQNELDRAFDKSSPRSSNTAVEAKDFISNASGCTKGWIQAMAKKSGTGVRCSDVNFEDLKLNGIVDSIKDRTLTSYGMLIASLLKNDTIPDDDEQGSLNSRMPMGATDNGSRQAQRSKILGGRNDEFNKMLNKAKVRESTRFSFKNYLIENN
jgi:hypothetical protein